MTPETVTLAISLALSAVSVVLGVFAIWLSLKFAQSSTTALDSVKDLAREMRTLIEANLSQQKEFSSRMLDSIIEQSKYGRNSVGAADSDSTEIQEFIRARLDATEQRVSKAVETTVRQLASSQAADAKELQRALGAIHGQIRTVSDVAPELARALKLPEQIEAALRERADYPANFVLLAAIVRTGAETVSDVQKAQAEYHIPPGWESAIDGFLSVGILEKAGDGFRIPTEFRAALEAWVARNSLPIRKLVARYKVKPAETGVTDFERALGRAFRF